MNYYQPNYMYQPYTQAYPQVQPTYQTPQPQPPTQAQAAQDDRIWIANESAANAYMVAANGFVRLWDSSQPVFYEKRADASGKPYPMVTYEYSPRTASQPAEKAVDLSGYVTREEFESWKKTLVGREVDGNE